MKRKITVSLFIFSLLFSTAWFLQQQQQNHSEINKNIHAVPIKHGITPLNSSLNTEEINTQWKLSKPFKPREYVRIREYMQEKTKSPGS